MKLLKKIKIITFSRFKKPKIEKWIEQRRKICAICKWNTKNQAKTSFKIKIIKALSDFYSFITFKNKQDNLGSCSVCGCSIYYKSSEEVEDCEKGKWKSIYISNKDAP